MSTKAERERNKAIDKNLRKVVKGMSKEAAANLDKVKADLQPGHRITGTTIGLITVPELHTLRTAVLLNQNMPTHTRASLEVLRSVLGKINDALRYCGEDISDINVRTEVFRSTGGENIQTLPASVEVANIVAKAAEMESRRADAVISALTEKPKPTPVTADSKKEATKEKRERLGVKSKKKVRDDWD